MKQNILGCQNIAPCLNLTRIKDGLHDKALQFSRAAILNDSERDSRFGVGTDDITNLSKKNFWASDVNQLIFWINEPNTKNAALLACDQTLIPTQKSKRRLFSIWTIHIGLEIGIRSGNQMRLMLNGTVCYGVKVEKAKI